MNKIDLRAVDLNLLVVFEALMQERSVTRAAESLHRTQSAVSHALGRLRDQLNDPLLVKTGGIMKPSPFALKLAEDVRPILASIERVLQAPQPFVPLHSRRSFRVAVPDFSPNLFPCIANTFLQQAPNATLEWCRLGDKILTLVAEGHRDVCLGPAHLVAPDGVSTSAVGHLHWGCYVRPQHPVLNEGWDAAAWERYPHVVVRVGDSPDNPVAQHSHTAGLQRRVAVWVPHFSAISDVLQTTDLVATMPTLVMRGRHQPPALIELPVPFSLPSIPQSLYWPTHCHSDPANVWLRELVADTFQQLQGNVVVPRVL